MILIDTPSFLATTLEAQTPMKVDKIIVNYSTRLGLKDNAPQGYVDSYIGTTEGAVIYSLEPIEMEVFTSDILVELHGMYIFHLSNLNPSLTFTSTL